MAVNGWTLLFHEALIGQLKTLATACQRARRVDAQNFRSNANVKLFRAAREADAGDDSGGSDPSRVPLRQHARRGVSVLVPGEVLSVGSGSSSVMTAGRASSSTPGSTTSAACASVVARVILMKCSGGCSPPAIHRMSGRRWLEVPKSRQVKFYRPWRGVKGDQTRVHKIDLSRNFRLTVEHVRKRRSRPDRTRNSTSRRPNPCLLIDNTATARLQGPKHPAGASPLSCRELP